MPTKSLLILIVLVVTAFPPLRGDDLHLELVDGAPKRVAADIAAQLVQRHIRLRFGDERDFCEIWLTKSWKTGDGGKVPADHAPIEYPLKQGSLVGVIHVPKTCFDLRDEEIPAGVYTLRYAVQPDSTDHSGSHDSRDFLLLLSAKDDKSPAPITKAEQLHSLSGAATDKEHPGFLALIKPEEPEGDNSVRPDGPNGWILLIHGKDESAKKIPMEIILPYEERGSDEGDLNTRFNP